MTLKKGCIILGSTIFIMACMSLGSVIGFIQASISLGSAIFIIASIISGLAATFIQASTIFGSATFIMASIILGFMVAATHCSTILGSMVLDQPLTHLASMAATGVAAVLVSLAMALPPPAISATAMSSAALCNFI